MKSSDKPGDAALREYLTGALDAIPLDDALQQRVMNALPQHVKARMRWLPKTFYALAAFLAIALWGWSIHSYLTSGYMNVTVLALWSGMVVCFVSLVAVWLATESGTTPLIAPADN